MKTRTFQLVASNPSARGMVSQAFAQSALSRRAVITVSRESRANIATRPWTVNVERIAMAQPIIDTEHEYNHIGAANEAKNL